MWPCYTLGYLAVSICLGVFDDVLKLQSCLQQHWLLTGDHLLVNGVVEVGHLHMETNTKKGDNECVNTQCCGGSLLHVLHGGQ